ncbi:ubiquinol-cytochrome C reductase [Hypoxylon sp. FL1284]|nr:ubiquinol-cytochrome C reductase [Hypoxylon sp. FL1284]
MVCSASQLPLALFTSKSTATPFLLICDYEAYDTDHSLHSALFRRNWQMLGAVFGGAFAFEMAYDTGMNKLWDSINKGRQWKDIRSRYVEEE